MDSIELRAPAKVNLYIKVLNKRKDSYHNILTLFERISLADRIRLEKISEGIRLSSDKPITRDIKENLAYKAAELILNHKKLKKGVNIRIEKRIPLGAGLGGGSSDAAAVLMGINRLFDLNLTKSALMRFARKLGADVPFFVFNTTFAIGMSRGDRLKIVRRRPRFWHFIVYPGFEISTKQVYMAFDRAKKRPLTKGPFGVKIKTLLDDLMGFRQANIESMLYNDLEDIVVFKKAIIGKIIRRLADLSGKKAIVTGSGPSVFCICKTRKEATEVRERLFRVKPANERGQWQTFVVRTKGSK